MACRYYDDILVAKLNSWIPDTKKLRVLKPDEVTRLIKTMADDSGDKAVKLPVIALSRSKDIQIRSNIKQLKSFDGLRLEFTDDQGPDTTGLRGKEYYEAVKKIPTSTALFNVIPILLNYQMDIYTKTYEEGDEYVRNFLFKLINNPKLIIDIPYNNATLKHTANIRVLDTVSDTTDISEHLFAGQFTRWTIQLEIQDAFLFNIPYKENWVLHIDDDVTVALEEKELSKLEMAPNLTTEEPSEVEVEPLDLIFKK